MYKVKDSQVASIVYHIVSALMDRSDQAVLCTQRFLKIYHPHSD